jgi:hypothetical protein
MVDGRLRSSVNGRLGFEGRHRSLYPSYDSEISSAVIAYDKREAFAHGSEATKQSILLFAAGWIASLRSQ